MKKIYVTVLLLIIVFGVVFYLLCYKKASASRKYVIGIVNPHSRGDDITRGFIEGLASCGYREGSNLTLIKCEKNKSAMDSALEDMLQQKADLIFTVTTPATRKAKKLSEKSGIPVVFAMHDPVHSKIIKNLHCPGGNLTGIKIRGSIPKAMEWLIKIKPDTKKIFVPVTYDTKAAMQSIVDLRQVAKQLKLDLVVAEVNSQEELTEFFSSLDKDVDAIFIVHSIFITENIQKILEVAVSKKLIVASGNAHYKKGVLVSFGLDRFNTGKQASSLAHIILQGADPAGIPIEVSVFFLGINLKTAKAIDLNISNDILIQANYIIR